MLNDFSSQGGNINILPFGNEINPLYAGIAASVLGGLCISGLVASRGTGQNKDSPSVISSFFLFFYSCFIKPHQGDSKASQQDALESFYKKQAGAYDATRKVLLRGREDMLALVAAQLEAKAETAADGNKAKRIWVDVRDFIAKSYLDSKILPRDKDTNNPTDTKNRSEAALAGILKPCRHSSMSPTSSPVSTSLISLRLSAK